MTRSVRARPTAEHSSSWLSGPQACFSGLLRPGFSTLLGTLLTLVFLLKVGTASVSSFNTLPRIVTCCQRMEIAQKLNAMVLGWSKLLPLRSSGVAAEGMDSWKKVSLFYTKLPGQEQLVWCLCFACRWQGSTRVPYGKPWPCGSHARQ